MKNFFLNGFQYFLKGFQYFLMFQVSVLVSMLISILFDIPIRLLVEIPIYQNLVFACLAFVLEIALILFFFYKEKMDFKNVSLIKFVSPCIVGVILHSALAYFNGFYMYTAGASVSESGIIWQSYHLNKNVTDMRDVALFRLIIPFIIILILRIGAVLLGFYIGKRKIKNFKQELKKE